MSYNKSNKRKRDVLVHQQSNYDNDISDEIDTSKPSAVFSPTGGRQHTLSIALPGSVIANCQTHETKTLLAAQVARACAVFCVDEIVVFNDGQSQNQPKKRSSYDHRDDETGYTGYSDPDDFLYHVLSYLETPPHLRKTLFPMHPNLRTAGMMPSLDMPHHLRANEWCQYREGVAISNSEDQQQQQQPQSGKKRKGASSSSSDTYTLIDCGLPVRARVPTTIPQDSRVTVKFANPTEPPLSNSHHTPLSASAVSPDTPREEAGYYWGYSTRLASNLSSIFTECPYDGGYDISVGTSERGIPISSLLTSSSSSLTTTTTTTTTTTDANIPPLPKTWNHLILVFGGVAGLEVALKADTDLTSKGVTEAKDVFDYWVNLVPQQGSRTIRTEEAVWLGLMGLREVVQARNDV